MENAVRIRTATSAVLVIALALAAVPASAQNRGDHRGRGGSQARAVSGDARQSGPRSGGVSGYRRQQQPQANVGPSARGYASAQQPRGYSGPASASRGDRAAPYARAPRGSSSGARDRVGYGASYGHVAVPRPPARYYRPGYGGYPGWSHGGNYRPGHGGYYRPYGGHYAGYYGGYYARPYYTFRPRFSIGFGVYVGFPVAFPVGFAFSTAGAYGYPGYAYGGSVAVVPGPSTYGGVSFEIDPPYTSVIVDGTYVGDAGTFSATAQPLTVVAGRHRIELRADGFQPVVFDLDVLPGQVVPYQGALVPLRPY